MPHDFLDTHIFITFSSLVNCIGLQIGSKATVLGWVTVDGWIDTGDIPPLTTGLFGFSLFLFIFTLVGLEFTGLWQ